MDADEPNKGGRPPGPDGPSDDFYGFRGPSSVFVKFRKAAGRSGPSILIKLISWWLGLPGAELPERPSDIKRAA